MPQSLNDIRTAYDLASEAYVEKFIDELNHKPRDLELLQEFASLVGAGNRVLDLGCGPGHTTAQLASLGLKAVGVDLSSEMAAKATKLFPNVDFTTGDFCQLPNQDNSVDGILAFYCIVHLQTEQLVTAFSEMFRVLKTGGVLLLSFHVGSEPVHVDNFLDTGAVLDFSPFLVEEVQSALEQAGFCKIRIHQRPPYDTEYPTHRCYLFAHRKSFTA